MCHTTLLFVIAIILRTTLLFVIATSSFVMRCNINCIHRRLVFVVIVFVVILIVFIVVGIRHRIRHCIRHGICHNTHLFVIAIIICTTLFYSHHPLLHCYRPGKVLRALIGPLEPVGNNTSQTATPF